MKKDIKNKGQVMLLSVLVISSAVLGATSLAGLLVLSQLRQASDAQGSAQAIFAADAGMECALYRQYRDNTMFCGQKNDPRNVNEDNDNGPSYIAYFELGDSSVKSLGKSSRSARAFELSFIGLEAFGDQFVD
jgi:hypothetical protein